MAFAPSCQSSSTVTAAPYVSKPVKYAQLSVTTVQTLDTLLAAASVPYIRSGLERLALVSVEGNGIRWTDDGQNPTTSYGQPVAVGAALDLTTDFSAVKIVSQTGTATVNVSFYQ